MLSLLLGLCCQDAHVSGLNMNYGDSLEKPRVGEGLHGTCKIQDIESKRDPGNCGSQIPVLGKTMSGPGPSAVT